MKKIINQIVVLVIVCLRCMSFACATAENLALGDVYYIDRDTFVPVFLVPCTEFEYDAKARGSICNELDSILMPGFYVRIDEVLENGIVRMTSTVDNSYKISGYIHRKFIEEYMIPCGKIDLESLKDPPNIPSIKAIAKRLIAVSNGRYCYGGNMPMRVKVDDLYRFSQRNSEEHKRPFQCCGFDSSGLVHYVSNGYLPHNTNEIIEFGVILFSFDTEKELPPKSLDSAFDSLADTDLVLFVSRDEASLSLTYRLGHVIMVWKLGFIEAGNPNSGILRTSYREAKARFMQMWKEAKAAGSDLYIIRWHPSLLSKKP